MKSIMEKETTNKYQFIICPVCQGSGKKRLGLSCPNCGGMGMGVFYLDRFYFFGLKIGKAVIKLNNSRKKCNIAVNLAAFLFGVSGLFALAWWVWKNNGLVDYDDYEYLMIWKHKSLFLLYFWITVIADMFVVYRVSEDKAFKQKVVPIKYNKKNKIIEQPSDWNGLKKEKRKNYKIDAAGGLDYETEKLIEKAYKLADELGHKEIKVIHIFFSLFEFPEVTAVFSRLNINFKLLAEKLNKQLAMAELGADKIDFAVETKEVFIEGYIAAAESGQKIIKAVNFILPCVARDKLINEILYDLEIDADKINNVIQWFLVNEKIYKNYKLYRRAAAFKPSNSIDRAYTAIATPILNSFARDLTLASKWGRLDLCVGRDEEIRKIFETMESGRSGIIMIGPDGIGKSAIINGIAQLMVEENVPDFLKDKRLVELDLPRLLSGVNPAEAEERLLAAMDEITRSGNIILFIDNIESLAGITAGAEESLELSDVLAGALDRKNFYCLSSATAENYAKFIEGKALGDALENVDIEEPSGNKAIQIIESKIGIIEGKNDVYFAYDAIETAVNLSAKYIHDKYLPEKAIKILETAAVEAARRKGKKALVTKDDAAVAISEYTHIPVTKVTEKESEVLLNLEQRIHERMINQVEAVKMVAASLRRARAELREGKRPIANFLFLGPTGVGKTELAKTVSEVYFGKEEYMIRVDMSEYQNQDSINKMIGDETGVKGYLTEAVRKKPFALILLDEFEKAHPNILNLFLQVMDDGRLTDGQGRTIDFTNSILIATSNAGALFIQDSVNAGMDISMLKDKLINEYLNKILRPELINRFDGVIVFKPLTMENVVEIAKLMLNKIGKMLKVKGMNLRVEDEGARLLAKQGFDPQFGARPLRRVLQEKVEDSIANKILGGELKRRDTVVINANAEVGVEKGRSL